VNLDEYWVASTFVQASSQKVRAPRFISTAIAIGSILLLITAVPVRAEPVPEAAIPEAPAAPETPAGGSALVDVAPTPDVSTPTATPEQTQPEPVVVEENVGAAETTGATAPSHLSVPAPDPVAISGSSATADKSSPSEANVPAKANVYTSLVSELDERASSAVRKVTRDSTLEDRAALGERVEQSIATTNVPPPAEALTEVLSGLPGVERLVRSAEEAIGEAAGSGRALLLDLWSPGPPAILSPRAGTSPPPAGPAALGGSHVPPVGRHISDSPASGAGHFDFGGTNVLGRYLAGFTPAELSRSGPTGDEDLEGMRPPAFASFDLPLDLATSVEHARDSAPVDVPAPLQAPGGATTAAGSSGSSFVPLVALLALLALAAPAIRRRLRVVPDFRAPTPFVCALERPG
jgi:hypothetical protein